MDAPVPLIAAALLAAGAILLPGARGRAWSMLGALVIAPVILLWHIADSEQLDTLTDRPAVAAGAAAVGLAAVGALALLFHRRPVAFPLAAALALPFRVPISTGGSTANLLVPLYLVVAAGALAYAVPRILGRATPEEHAVGWLERVLGLTVLLYAVQAIGSSDFDKALENTVFFFVPFAVLFVLLGRVAWTTRLAVQCLGVLTALAVVFVGIGFVEYATRHLLLNPKVIASNQFEEYFRVNSLFFDPNIYGRFLAVVMLAVTCVLLWTRRARDFALTAALLALLWPGLLLTLSQSSFAALLVGLAVLGGLRWDPRRAAMAAGGVVVVGVLIVLLAGSAIRLDLGSADSLDDATSGRVELVEGGLRLFGDAPLLGHGSGSFSREYRRAEDASGEQAVSASHTIPVTVAAEQGVVGLALYLALLALAFVRLFRAAARDLVRVALAAAFAAVVVHTLSYAAFLEDPVTWALLGAGVALARLPRTAAA
ncbi:O-antigen ligase [Conexibacter sp. SYSU D00693]|uniref:O-antigen ligase family protein n=1 Tax=Conexibacter sp. SYSU D00693 TaxID=2812560 RepID=UPI00196AEACE|nr:O-antigen ligase family protein [Conexibacter sp. SYSU D00693]